MPFESKGAGIYELVRTIWTILCVLLTILVNIPEVESHGRLVEPPSRSTMFRLGFNNPPNYDDTQLFCGGVKVSHCTLCLVFGTFLVCVVWYFRNHLKENSGVTLLLGTLLRICIAPNCSCS